MILGAVGPGDLSYRCGHGGAQEAVDLDAPDLDAEIAAAAAQEGMSYSAWPVTAPC